MQTEKDKNGNNMTFVCDNQQHATEIEHLLRHRKNYNNVKQNELNK